MCYLTTTTGPPSISPVTDWTALTKRTLDELGEVDARFRPTNFWAPGLERLLSDMDTLGLENFKSWPTARYWFYPLYSLGLTDEKLEGTLAKGRELYPRLNENAARNRLSGKVLARRDFDAARLAWDHTRWPTRLERFGESEVGSRGEAFHLTGQRPAWTRPHLNYMLCMAALSRHVDEPPTSLLELGGGFGALGEFLMSRSEEFRYVDLDIPPLMTVASYYLRTLFGDRVQVADELPERGPVSIEGSGVLPNWRIGDVQDPFDVFLNAFSFQEMEPDVVSHYIELVAAKDITHVVSLNSRKGKNRLSEGATIGVEEPVTSDFIVAEFERRGFTLLERYGSPLLHSAGELAVLRRTDDPAERRGRSRRGRWSVARRLASDADGHAGPQVGEGLHLGRAGAQVVVLQPDRDRHVGELGLALRGGPSGPEPLAAVPGDQRGRRVERVDLRVDDDPRLAVPPHDAAVGEVGPRHRVGHLRGRADPQLRWSRHRRSRSTGR